MAGLMHVAAPLLALLSQEPPFRLDVGLGPHTVSGRVVSASGALPAELQVWVFYPTERGSTGMGGPLQPGGRFVVSGLSSGTYVLSVQPAVDGPEHHPSGFERGSAVVTVRDSDVDGVVIDTAPGMTLRGRIRFEETRPGSDRPDTVLVHAALAKTEWAGPRDSAVMRLDGAFEIPDVRGPRIFQFGWTATPGTYWTPRKVLLDGIDITNVPVDFAAVRWNSLEIVFTQGWTGIVGRVEDVAGLPVSACVVMLPADSDLRRGWSTAVGTMESDGRGRFYFSNVPAGEYYVFAREADACPPIHEVVTDVRDVPRAATRTTVNEGGAARIIVTAASRASRH